MKYFCILFLLALTSCSDTSKNVDNLSIDKFESILKVANEIRARIIMARITPYEHDSILILSKRLKDLVNIDAKGRSAADIIQRTFSEIDYEDYGEGFLNGLLTKMKKDLVQRCSLNQAENKFSERSKLFIAAYASGLNILDETLNSHPDTILFKEALEHERSEYLAKKQAQEVKEKEQQAARATENAVANGVIAGRMISKMFGF